MTITQPIHAVLQYDMIGRFLQKLTGGSAFRSFYISFVLGLVTNILYGLWILNQTSNSTTIIQITDYSEAVTVVWGVLANIPTIWAVYIWQPKALLQTFTSLEKLHAVDANIAINKIYYQNFVQLLQKRSTLIVVIIAFIFVTTISIPIIVSNSNPQLYHQQSIWWRVHPLYTYTIWIPFTYLAIYMLIWIIVRHLLAIQTITHLLQNHKIRLIVFHPDQSNGLAPISTYLFSFGQLLIVSGIWILIWVVPPFVGNDSYNVISFSFLILGTVTYLTLPIILIGYPLLKIHNIMKVKEAEIIEKIALEIHDLLVNAGDENIQQNIEKVDLLQQKRVKISEGFAKYPFVTPSAIRFFLAYVFPFLTSLVSVAQSMGIRIP